MDYRFIGYCNDPKENHDKVWGAVYVDEGRLANRKVMTFWGRRGKKLQTKMTTDSWELHKLIDSKENKGYASINENRLSEVYPEFQLDLEKTLMWSILMA